MHLHEAYIHQYAVTQPLRQRQVRSGRTAASAAIDLAPCTCMHACATSGHKYDSTTSRTAQTHRSFTPQRLWVPWEGGSVRAHLGMLHVFSGQEDRLLDKLVMEERRSEGAQLALHLGYVARADVLLQHRLDARPRFLERQLRICTRVAPLRQQVPWPEQRSQARPQAAAATAWGFGSTGCAAAPSAAARAVSR